MAPRAGQRVYLDLLEARAHGEALGCVMDTHGLASPCAPGESTQIVVDHAGPPIDHRIRSFFAPRPP
jgi:hypothetical protein